MIDLLKYLPKGQWHNSFEQNLKEYYDFWKKENRLNDLGPKKILKWFVFESFKCWNYVS